MIDKIKALTPPKQRNRIPQSHTLMSTGKKESSDPKIKTSKQHWKRNTREETVKTKAYSRLL